MDESRIILVCTALFAAVLTQFLLQLRRRDHLALMTWPALMYVGGPALTLMFADSVSLGRYVWPDEIVPATVLMVCYVVVLGGLGRILQVGRSIRACLAHRSIQRLSSSPLFLPIYVVAASAAAALQMVTLVTFGSVFTGTYVLEGVDEGLIPYWGFLAGLYEIVFLCFVLYLLGKRRGLAVSRTCILLYVFTAALRLAGGTRLLLVKELAFMLLLLYLKGTLKPRTLLIWGVVALCLGSLVGLLRTPDQDTSLLGPFFGLVMESGLNALTLNIGYHVQDSGFVANHAEGLRTFLFFLINVLPTFARFGIDEVSLKSLSPYELAIDSGLDSSAPVGGMSGFATVCYLTSHPFFFVIILAFTICVLIRFTPPGALRAIAVTIFIINAIHFWRDPADIAFKLFVQGMVVSGLLYLVPSRRHRPRTRRLPAVNVEPAT